MTALPRPDRSEYADYYHRYLEQVPDGDVVAHLRRQSDATRALLGRIDEARRSFRYADGKWTIAQVVGHLADGERLFAHRALAIARRDPADQPSMDQDVWMAAAGFERRTLASLADELQAARAATIALVATFDAEVGARTGKASGNPFTVRSLVWAIAGHELHHLRVLRERYGVG